MLTIKKRKGSPYFYVRGTVHGQSVYASTKETDKASARRFKDALEIRLARSAGQKCDALTFREATALYLEFRRPQKTNQIDRLCTVIGDRLLTDIRSAALVDAAARFIPAAPRRHGTDASSRLPRLFCTMRRQMTSARMSAS